MGTKSKIIIGVLVAIFMSALIYQISTKEKTINNNKELVLTSNINKITQNDKQVNPPMPQKVPSFITRGEGVGWSSDKLISVGTNPGSYDSEIAAEGNYVHVVFTEPYGSWPSTWAEVRYVRSTDGGKTWESPILVSHAENTAGKYSWRPDVAVSGSNVYVVWDDNRGSDWDIYMNISRDNGETWSGEFNISSIDNYESGWPCVGVDRVNPNVVVVAWAEERWAGSLSHDIYIRVSADNGTTWGERIRVTNATDLDPMDEDMDPIFVVHNWTVYMVFGRYFNETGRYEVMFEKIKINSSNINDVNCSNAVMLSYYDDYNDVGAHIAMDDEGHVYVVWRNSSNLGDRIYLRRSADYGNNWYPMQKLTDGNASDPKISVDENGYVSITYVFDNPWGMYYMESENYGENWSEPVCIVLRDTVKAWFDYCIDGGKKHLVFVDNRTGKYEVYYKRSPPFGDEGVVLVNGWNFISLPARAPDGYTARDLADDIENTTDYLVMEICYWDTVNCTWMYFGYRDGNTHALISIGENFVVPRNKSIFVSVCNETAVVDATWNPEGFTAYNSVTTPDWLVYYGWNPVALPYNSSGAGMLRTSRDILNKWPFITAVADWNESTGDWMIDNGSGEMFSLRYTIIGELDNTYNWNGIYVYSSDHNCHYIDIS